MSPSIEEINALAAENQRLRAALVADIDRPRRGTMVLDRATCNWVVDEEGHTAMCWTPGHGETIDGVDSAHFPGASR